MVTTHGRWIIKKAIDAKRGVLERCKYTSILDRWQKDEVYRASQLVHGWTDEWVKYLDVERRRGEWEEDTTARTDGIHGFQAQA